MKALVVRRKTTNAILACGPDNGMYAPAYDPGTASLQIEPDLDAVIAEWQATVPPPVDKRQQALINPGVPQWFKDWIA